MSTQFNFPASPTVGDFFTLPNGSITQWNGTEWVSVDNSNIAYPLVIGMGGTGATTAPQARINLGLNSATGEFIVQKDGTVALPGIAFATQPDLGFWKAGAGTIGVASQGKQIAYIGGGSGGDTAISLNAWSASGASHYYLTNQPIGTANYNVLAFDITGSGLGVIRTAAAGSATRGNLTIDAPQVFYNDGTAAAPVITFGGEAGLGWYRLATGAIAMSANGTLVSYLTAATPTVTTMEVIPRATGTSLIALRNNLSAGNSNQLILQQNADASATIKTGGFGTFTRGSLTLDTPMVYVAGSGVTINSPSGNYANFVLNKASGTNSTACAIFGQTANNLRWSIYMGGTEAESGAAVGSDFSINSYSNTGAYQSSPVVINRSNGYITLTAPNVTFSNTVSVNNQLVVTAAATNNWSVISMNAFAGGGSGTALEGRKNNVSRWSLSMPNSTGETGANVGSDLTITRYDDAGNWLGTPFYIARNTGNVVAQGLTREVDHLEVRDRLDAAIRTINQRLTRLEKHK